MSVDVHLTARAERQGLAPLPEPRGPASEELIEVLQGPPGDAGPGRMPDDDPVDGEDSALALHLHYELHYRGWAGVDDGWEWEPSLIARRRALERRFEQAVRERAEVPEAAPAEAAARLVELIRDDDGPSLSRHLVRRGTLEQYRELLAHRSAYHLKEADPHTFAIPRLGGRAKAALVEVQADEYGGGRPEWVHAELFRRSMEGLGLDGRYGALIDHVPAVTLSTVNLMSLFGLNRRLRGAVAGHLAVLETTSSLPMRRYGDGLRRLGADEPTTRFFDEHVEADAVHEQIAVHDLCGALCEDEPALAGDVLFGAAAVLWLEARFASHLLGRWEAGETSLRRPLPPAPPA